MMMQLAMQRRAPGTKEAHPSAKARGPQHERLTQLAAAAQRAQAPAQLFGDGTIQREVENAKYDKTNEANSALARTFFDAYDVAVQKAYRFVITVPSLGAYAGVDGRTALWSRLWGDHLAGKRPKLLAASFGYVIESLVTFSPDFRPTPPGGCSVLPQFVSGGTRPDLVLTLTKGGKQVAWLDLTASESADHIFEKEDWSSKIAIYAEVTYPSLTLAAMALMKQNKDNKGALSVEEFQKRQLAAQQEYEKKKTFWIETGKNFRVSTLKPKQIIGSLTWETSPEKGRAFIVAKLQEYFETPIDIKLVPSILIAMGVNPVTWQFTTGTNQSVKAGEAWLIDNAPLPEETESETEESGTEVKGMDLEESKVNV